jgi:hypothetical protein
VIYRSGEGRGDATGANLYENFAESTIGKVNDMENVLPPAAEDLQEKAEAEEEEERAKEGGGDKKLGRSSECCFAVLRDGKLMRVYSELFEDLGVWNWRRNDSG